MKIQIKPFKHITYEVWSDSEGFIGLADVNQISDIRIQCIINSISDIYVKFEDKKVYINESGDFSIFPYGFLDHTSKFLTTVIKLKRNKQGLLKHYELEDYLEKYNDYLNKYLL